MCCQTDIATCDYEVICVDDGSADNTVAVIEGFVRRHNVVNLKVLSQENRGVSSARNNGVRASVGRYITFVDADDTIPVNLLGQIKSILIKKDFPQLLIGCLRQFESDELPINASIEKITDNDLKIIFDRTALRSMSVLDIDNWKKQNSPCAQFIRRDLIEINKIAFNEEMTIGEDLVYTYFLKKYAHCAVFVNAALYFVGKRENSATRKITTEQLIMRHKSRVTRALLFDDERKSDEYADPFYNDAKNSAVTLLMAIKDKKYVKSAREKMRAYGLYPPCISKPRKTRARKNILLICLTIC